jgi:hypothetical protein
MVVKGSHYKSENPSPGLWPPSPGGRGPSIKMTLFDGGAFSIREKVPRVRNILGEKRLY